MRRLGHLSTQLVIVNLAVGIQFLAPEQVRAQIAGPGVNMVSGTEWPGGDPFLQRQNTPSMAVSTRNELHLLAGDNDYRTVDLPGLPDGSVTGDAWLGVFKSLDGGKTWYSDLMPGYPQDKSLVGQTSPAYGSQAGTDPVMRSGTNGMFYYAGLVFNRTPVAGGNFGASAIVVSRYMDTNSPTGDPIQFLGTSVVAQGVPPQTFTDKPWIAVDIPRSGALSCTFDGQTFPGGNLYVTYTLFQGDQLHGAISFQRSRDCGLTWDPAIHFTDSAATRQGSAIAVDPNSGAVYVTWRQFSGFDVTDAIYVVKSVDGGQTFTPAVQVATIAPFDQGSTFYTFRTNSYPSITVDGNGEVYIAWSQRGVGPGGDARIVISTSPNGQSWSAPVAADNQPNRGHQFMPAITFADGQLMLVYYDLRDDNTFTLYDPLGEDVFSESQTTPEDPLSLVFSQFVDDTPTVPPAPPRQLRHMIDVRVAQGIPGSAPVFNSTPVSSYSFGSLPPDNKSIEQMQVDPPNFPMFAGGTQAYIGDYLDIATKMFTLSSTGTWIYKTAPANDAVYHAVWTDNRDVRPPADGNWANYTPVGSQGQPSIFDPTQLTPACVDNQEGMRNQNIYTANVTQGVVVASPDNAKLLLGSQLKAFVITLENSSAVLRVFRLTVLNQPPGGRAVFSQATNLPVPLTHLDVSVPAFSTVARSVFASSTVPNAQVRVLAQEITAPGGTVLPGGLQSTIVLNADPTDPNLSPSSGTANSEIYSPTVANPNIANPNIANPNIANPNIANPNIANPNIANPNIANPNIANPNIANPNIANPNIANPNIANPNIANPNIANPNIANPNIAAGDLLNGAVSDVSWTITNTGNSAMAYTIKTLLNGQVPTGFKTQLMVYQFYSTPVAENCTLGVDVHTKVLANIINPVFEQANNNDAADPSITNSASNDPTVSLSPGETANVTLRVVNPDKTTNTNFDLANTFITTVTSHGANTTDLQQGNTQPPVAASQLIVITQTLPNASLGNSYNAKLVSAGGNGAVTWSSPGLPANGLSLNPVTGAITGTPLNPGSFPIAVTATDSGTVPRQATRSFSLTITAPPAPTIATASLPIGYPGVPYNAMLSAIGGTATKTWSVTSGSLPAGLNLTPSTGAITGTPSVSASSSITITATDALLRASSKLYTLQVAPLTLTFVEPPSNINAFQQDAVQIKAANAAGTGIGGLKITVRVVLPNNTTLTSFTVTTGTGGIAAFNISVNQPGVNYTLLASATGVAPITSPPFTIAAIANVPQLLVADGSAVLDNGSLIQVPADGSSSSVFASTGGCPSSIALDSFGNRFVADPCTTGILKVTPAGAISAFFIGAPLQNPVALAVDASNNVIVGDDSTDGVYRISADGSSISQIASLSPSPSNLQDIAIAVDAGGNVIVANDDVTSPGVASELLSIAPGGAVSTIYRGTAITGTSGLVIDHSGNYIIGSSLQASLFRVTPQGAVSTLVNSPALTGGLSGLALDAFGNFYAALNQNVTLVQITAAGEVTTIFSGAPLTAPNSLVIVP